MTFNSLDEMTQHMKMSPRCGMAGMQQANAVSAASSHTSSSGSSNATNNSSTASSAPVDRSLTGQSNINQQQHHSSKSSKLSSATNLSTSSLVGMNKEKDKSGNQVPRKLVRGQDVWLGRGAEQTRQILKCKCLV